MWGSGIIVFVVVVFGFSLITGWDMALEGCLVSGWVIVWVHGCDWCGGCSELGSEQSYTHACVMCACAYVGAHLQLVCQ